MATTHHGIMFTLARARTRRSTVQLRSREIPATVPLFVPPPLLAGNPCEKPQNSPKNSSTDDPVVDHLGSVKRWSKAALEGTAGLPSQDAHADFAALDEALNRLGCVNL